MSDEGFHEIQLNGKQLVFLFMAATVVSVVIFLCGVMVGRGVRATQGTVEASEFAGASPVEDPVRHAGASPPAGAPAPVPAEGQAPAEPAEGGGYYDALTDAPERDATMTPPAASREEPAPKAEEKPPAPAPARPPATPPSAVTSSEGFVVQLAALRDRTEADAIVRRLSSKGYAAFVVNPLPGTPPVYKVQVGRFAQRAEADRVSARLRLEEQFSPWVTR